MLNCLVPVVYSIMLLNEYVAEHEYIHVFGDCSCKVVICCGVGFLMLLELR